MLEKKDIQVSPASSSHFSVGSRSRPRLEWANSAWLSAVGGRWQLRKAALANQVMVSDTWFSPLASLDELFLEHISL
jgi:hypothetical protein